MELSNLLLQNYRRVVKRLVMHTFVMYVLSLVIWVRSSKNFDQVLIPEINNGQLIKIIRDTYLVDAKGYNKIMGVPITKTELVLCLEEMLGSKN